LAAAVVVAVVFGVVEVGVVACVVEPVVEVEVLGAHATSKEVRMIDRMRKPNNSLFGIPASFNYFPFVKPVLRRDRAISI